MANRLAGSSSPYLLQHADNPVDWWEWSDEAFDEAATARRAGAAVGRLRRLPLVPRDGPRVVRGRRGGRRGQRRLRRGQGRPRGAPGRRRGLHGRGDGADRSRRVADDLPAHAGRRPVLRGHLPTQGAAARAAGQRRRGVGASSATGCWPPGRASPSSCGCTPARRHPRGWMPGSATPRCGRLRSSTTTRAAGSAARPSSRRRWCSSSCCATTPAPARPTRSRWRAAPARRWPAAGCTTSSAAASPGTPSTPTGWCRTSRRCSTTTPSCCGCTPTSGARPATPSRAG